MDIPGIRSERNFSPGSSQRGAKHILCPVLQDVQQWGSWGCLLTFFNVGWWHKTKPQIRGVILQGAKPRQARCTILWWSFSTPKDIWRLWGHLLQKETFILDLMKSLSSTNISSKYSTIATKKRQAFGTQSMFGDKSSNPMTSVRCFRRHHSAAWMDLKCLSLCDTA